MLDENNDDSSNIQSNNSVISGIPEPSIAAPDPSTPSDTTAADDAPVDLSNIAAPGLDEPGTSTSKSSIDDLSSVVSPSKDGEDSAPTNNATSPDSSALASIKQDALKQLSPLISHLDQEPEEKFKTLMMMVQASDDQSLLQEIHETAQKIVDDKARAQALLDVVNEINYFTQHNKSQ